MTDYFDLPPMYRLGLLGDMYLRGLADAITQGRVLSTIENHRRIALHFLDIRGHDVDENLRERIAAIDDSERLAEIIARTSAHMTLREIFLGLPAAP